ncbi:MAG: FHA domain-containing protein [Acidobacteriota bacterium]
MRRDPTKVMPGSQESRGFQQFLTGHDVKLVQVSGDAAGTQFELRQEVQTLGRGADADLVIDTEAASRKHAAIEFAGGQFRVRDLGSTNGFLLNGKSVQTANLQHGDQIEIGGQVFQFICDTRDVDPETYQIDADD